MRRGEGAGKLSGEAVIFQLRSPVLWLEQGPQALEQSKLCMLLWAPGAFFTCNEKLNESRESERWSMGGDA